jgi:hypothetical protein
MNMRSYFGDTTLGLTQISRSGTNFRLNVSIDEMYHFRTQVQIVVEQPENCRDEFPAEHPPVISVK